MCNSRLNSLVRRGHTVKCVARDERLVFLGKEGGSECVIQRKYIFQNYPLSWVETTENNTLIGRGVAFEVFDILQEQFNFTYDVITPSQNFEIGGREPDQSLIGLVNSTVSI